MRFRAKWTLIHFGTPFVFFPLLLLLLLLDTLDEREKAQKPPHVSLLSRGTLFFAVGHSDQLKNPFVLLLFFFFLCLSARLSAFSVVSVSQFRSKKVDAHSLYVGTSHYKDRANALPTDHFKTFGISF